MKSSETEKFRIPEVINTNRPEDGADGSFRIFRRPEDGSGRSSGRQNMVQMDLGLLIICIIDQETSMDRTVVTV